MYTVEGLEHGIERAKVNIVALRKAIGKEKATIREYETMIAALREKDRTQAEIRKNVRLEIVRDDIPE